MSTEKDLPSPNKALQFGFEYSSEEFNSLRTEIISRQQIQFQLVSLVLISAGALFSFALQNGMQPEILAIFPLLVMLLNMYWANNSKQITIMANFIRCKYESGVQFGYETFLQKLRAKGEVKSHVSIQPAIGIFLGVQIISLFLYVNKVVDFTNPSSFLKPLTIVLSVINIIIIVFTFTSTFRTAQFRRKMANYKSLDEWEENKSQKPSGNNKGYSDW